MDLIYTHIVYITYCSCRLVKITRHLPKAVFCLLNLFIDFSYFVGECWEETCSSRSSDPDYCDVVCQNAVKSCLCWTRFVLGRPFLTHHCTMYYAFNWPSLNVTRHTYFYIHFYYSPYLQQYLRLDIFSVPCDNKSVEKKSKSFYDWLE